jgi:hypothetical protein
MQRVPLAASDRFNRILGFGRAPRVRLVVGLAAAAWAGPCRGVGAQRLVTSRKRKSSFYMALMWKSSFYMALMWKSSFRSCADSLTTPQWHLAQDGIPWIMRLPCSITSTYCVPPDRLSACLFCSASLCNFVSSCCMIWASIMASLSAAARAAERRVAPTFSTRNVHIDHRTTTFSENRE